MTHPAMLDPLLLALVEKLPAKGETFCSTEQEAWLTAAGAILALLDPPAWTQEARERGRRSASPPADLFGAARANSMTWGGPAVAEYMRAAAQVVNAEMRDRLPEGCEVSIDTAPLLEEESSHPTADAVDDATSPDPGGETTTGADDAEATSPPLPPAGPDSEPSSPSMGGPAPTKAAAKPAPKPPTPIHKPTLAERLEAKGLGLVSDVEQPGRIAPPKPGEKRQFTNRQKANIVRRCVKEGVEVVADAEQLAAGTLNRWMREFHHVVLATQDAMGAPPRGRS